jgi:isochorismate synthase EntC
MVNTRRCNANTENNNPENNNTANPPPPPTLEQVLVTQAQMLQIMQQSMVNMQQTLANMQQNQWSAQLQQRDKLGEFQRTKLPTFLHSMEPMDADEWLKTVEKMLQVVQYNNREKVLLASHQLIDSTSDW